MQKEYENEEMRKKHGSSYRAVGGANRKCGRVLPSTATKRWMKLFSQRAVETAGMAETIDEKGGFGKSGRKTGEYAGYLAVLFDRTV